MSINKLSEERLSVFIPVVSEFALSISIIGLNENRKKKLSVSAFMQLSKYAILSSSL